MQLCGRLVVELGGRRLEDELPSRQGRLLFAYLVLNRERPVRREELIEAIWPEVAPADPAAALATVLSRLRRVLGGDVLPGKAEVRLALPDGAEIDVEVAIAAIARAETAVAQSDWRGAWGPAHAALAITERGLLPSLEAPWIDERRRALDDLQLTALQLVAETGLGLGGMELAAADRAAVALIERAPFRESGYALRMQVLAARGDVAEALAVYEELRVRLREELGTGPSGSVAALHERLLRGEPAATRTVPEAGTAQALPLPTAVVLAAQGPFVGRHQDLELLQAALARAQDGGQQLVALVGEAGVGKTRLAAQLACQAHAAGVRVLHGRCDEEAVIPYQPIAEALRHYVATAPEDELRRLVSPPLARLVPGLRERLPDLPQAEAVEPAAERYLLFESVATLMAALARQTGSVVLLDDVHWADPETVLLVRHLARSPEPARRLMVMTAREADVVPGGPLADLLSELAGERGLQRLPLRGLALDDVEQLVSALTGPGADPGLGRAIHSETNGNPFFAVELVRHLGETRGFDQGSAGAVPRLPDTVRNVVGRRIARLGPDADRALTVAAIVGQRFELDIVEAAGAGEDAADALDLAVAAGLLEEDAAVPGRFAFAHALVRQFLRERLSVTRRARLHAAVGEAVEARRPDDARLGELAFHYAAAAIGSDVERAIAYTERAGRHSAAQLSYEDAAQQFATALALLARADAPDPARRCDLLLALGGAENRSGSPRARQTHLEAAAAARELGDPERLARAALGFGGEGLAGMWWHEVGTEDAELLALLRDGLAALEDRDGPLRARLLARLAAERLWSGDLGGLEQLSTEALAMARRVGEPSTLAFALAARCLAISDPERLAERGGLAEQLVSLSGELRDRELEMMARGLHMACALAAGDRGPFDAGVDARARIAEEVPQPLFRWYAAASRGLSAHLDGRFEDAERLFAEGLAMGSQVQPSNARQAHAGQLLTLRYDQGRLAETAVAVREYAERYAAFAAWRCALALVLAETGHRDAAREELARLAAGGGFTALRRGTGWLIGLDFAAKAALACGATAHAAELHDLLAPLADRLVLIGMGTACSGAVAATLSGLACELGRPDEARRLGRQAVALAERARSTPMLGYARCALAGALLAGGAPDQAEDQAVAALGIARALGMARLVARTEELLVTPS